MLTVPSGQSPNDEDNTNDNEQDVPNVAAHRHK